MNGQQTILLNQVKGSPGESQPKKVTSKKLSVKILQRKNETLRRDLAVLRDQTLTQQEQSDTEKKQFFNELEACVEQVRSLASILTLAEQQERSRISHVLHDDLRQLVYSLLIRLEMLNLQFPTHQSLILAARFNKTIQGINQAIDLMRGLADEVDPLC